MKIETVDDRIKALSQSWRLSLPPGPGPFPLVALMHGCGGCSAFQDGYAAAAVEAGVAALVIDSYPHRGIGEKQAFGLVCTGLKLWGRERAGDLFAALTFARRHPAIQADRLYAAGWSHGGWSLLDAMAVSSPRERARWTGLADLSAEPLDGLMSAFAVYPYCGMASVAQGRGLRWSGTVETIVCGADTVVGSSSLRDRLTRLPKPGAPLKTHWFDGATHAFDEPEASDPRFRFDQALALRARGLWQAWLRTQ